MFKSLLALVLVACCHAQSLDYIVQLQLAIAEDRIPNYLVGVIYERPVQKQVSSLAVLDLYQAESVNLEKMEQILDVLNISQSQMFSLNGFHHSLDTFDWTFTNFYNTFTTSLGLTGLELRSALEQLQIDVAQFSSGITYGVPDPWQEFIKGNFSRENLELACTAGGITMDQMWQGVRDIFINDVITIEILDLVRLLHEHNIHQNEALVIWEAIPITVSHVYSQPLFSDIIGNFTARIQNQTSLGVLIGEQNIAIHKSIHDVFRDERELIDVKAQTLVTRTTLDIEDIDDDVYRNLAVMTLSADIPNLTVIDVAKSNSDLENCTYVTFQNNNLLTINVATAQYHEETYLLPRSVITNVVPGSALVCGNTVYGLAREADSSNIVVDAFSDAEHSGTERAVAGLAFMVVVATLLM